MQITPEEIKTVDPFASIIIFFLFQYLLNDLIYLKISEHFFTPSDLAYSIFGFLFASGAAILYLSFRGHFISVKSFLVKNRTEWLVVILGILTCILLDILQSIFGGLNQSFSELSDLSQPYRYLTLIFILFVFPLIEGTFFLGYFFEILRNNWGKSIAALATLSSLLLFYVSTLNGITPAIFLVLFQLVFLIAYMSGGLGSAILIHSFLNIHLYYSGAY